MFLNLISGHSRSFLSGWQYALRTSEFSAYDPVSNTNAPVSYYWLTTVSYLCVSLTLWLNYTSEEKHLLRHRPRGLDTEFFSCTRSPGSISHSEGLPQSPSMTPPWIDDDSPPLKVCQWSVEATGKMIVLQKENLNTNSSVWKHRLVLTSKNKGATHDHFDLISVIQTPYLE